MLEDKVFAVMSIFAFMWILSFMTHVVLIEDQHLLKMYHIVIFPLELLSCILYAKITYTMMNSSCIFVKSMGYGVAVAPIIAFAEIHS